MLEGKANDRWNVKIIPSMVIIALKPANLISLAPPTPANQTKGVIDLDEHLAGLDLAEKPLFAMNSSLRVWMNINYFYPFGNTPAKQLMHNVPAYVDCAKLLLLGCGDPRHILFTVWSLRSAGGLSARQCMDFTACDIEPSILARNIILYKLIADGVSASVAWALFYGKRVDDYCMDTLITAANALLSFGETLEAWHESAFGQVLRFCNTRSFDLVRGIWQAYAQGKVNASRTRAADAHQAIVSRKTADASHVILTGVAHTIPCFSQGARNVVVHSDLAKAYAKSTQGTPQVIATSDGPTYCNPMILRTPAQLADWHYALEPTFGYQLSALYAPLLRGPLCSKDSSPSGLPSAEDIHRFCLNQFTMWCATMKEALEASFGQERKLITIRHFAGDMLDCGRALNNQKHGNVTNLIPNASVSSLQFVDGPTSFDFIDTSNCSDHQGLLAVLILCKPLLCPVAHARIATETLSTATKETARLDDLLAELLRCDLSTFAALTGLTTVDACTRVSENYRHMNTGITKLLGSVNERKEILVEWFYLPSLPSVHQQIDVDSLTTTLLAIYQRIFCPAYGCMEGGRPDMMTMLAMEQLGQNDYAQPTSQCYASLLRLCLEHLRLLGADATFKMVDVLLAAIRCLPYIMQGNYIQELYMWCHAYGLISDEHYLTFSNDSLYHKNIVPKTLQLSVRHYQVTLLVPRSILEGRLEDIASPLMEMGVMSSSIVANHFSCIHLVYVTDVLRQAPSLENAISLRNFTLLPGDASNYKYVAITSMVPFGSLRFMRPEDTYITLQLRTVMGIRSREAMRTLGPQMQVFKACMTDSNHVNVAEWDGQQLAECILMLSGSSTVGNLNNSTAPSSSSAIEVISSGCSTVVTKSAWESIFSPPPANPAVITMDMYRIKEYKCIVSFRDPAILKHAQLKIIDRAHPLHCRLCLLEDKIDSDYVDIRLPCRLDVSRALMQIGRNKGIIILTLPVSESAVVGNHRSFFMYRDIQGDRGMYAMLGATRALLESMPIINNKADARQLDWLFSLAGAQILLSERNQLNEDVNKKPAFLSMRETIHAMLMHMTNQCGQGGPAMQGCRCFFILSAPRAGGEIFIYGNSIRMDISQGTVLMDCAVCCLTQENVQEVGEWSTLAANDANRVIVNISDSEVELWRKFLPVCCERARNTWEHQPDCGYVANPAAGSEFGEIPLSPSLAVGAPVMCQCCLGHDLQDTPFAKHIKKQKELQRHFFRAAISPLFPAFISMFAPEMRAQKKGSK